MGRTWLIFVKLSHLSENVENSVHESTIFSDNFYQVDYRKGRSPYNLDL